MSAFCRRFGIFAPKVVHVGFEVTLKL